MSSYAYYVEDDPIVSDAEYDIICRMLDENWEEIEHSHKSWVVREDLKAGTGYSLEYPDRVKHATQHYREAINDEV